MFDCEFFSHKTVFRGKGENNIRSGNLYTFPDVLIRKKRLQLSDQFLSSESALQGRQDFFDIGELPDRIYLDKCNPASFIQDDVGSFRKTFDTQNAQ